MRQKSSKKEKKYFVYIFFGALSVSLVSILNFMLIRRLKKNCLAFTPVPRETQDMEEKLLSNMINDHFNMQDKGSAISGTGLIHDFKSIVATSLQHCQFKSMPKL